MPPRGQQHFRYSDEDWADLGAQAELLRTSRSQVIRELLDWYRGLPAARLPVRLRDIDENSWRAIRG